MWLEHVKRFLNAHSVFSLIICVSCHYCTWCHCMLLHIFSCFVVSRFTAKSRGSGYLTVLWRHLEDVWKLWSQPSTWACEQRKVRTWGALTCRCWLFDFDRILCRAKLIPFLHEVGDFTFNLTWDSGISWREDFCTRSIFRHTAQNCSEHFSWYSDHLHRAGKRYKMTPVCPSLPLQLYSQLWSQLCLMGGLSLKVRISSWWYM